MKCGRVDQNLIRYSVVLDFVLQEVFPLMVYASVLVQCVVTIKV
jgi:hypothetical protein